MKASVGVILGGASTALAAVKGYNYASQGASYDTFASQFRTAASLEGATDFTSGRLYTMIQEGTTNTPISAIQAALDTQSTLLLGLWASTDQNGFNNELAALTNAINQYGEDLANIAIGISVGSEDLYRISPTGIAAESGYGQSPDVLVDYIGQVRDTIRDTALADVPVGHVDTWNVYVNGSNANVIAASDWLGLDEYPYYQTTDPNSIDNARNVFFESYDRVAAVANGKPIWITEAGWPTSGPTSGQAVASVDNAETFWQEVCCELQSRDINVWWYILADAGASPSFGVSNNGQPLYDLTCRPRPSSSAGTSSGSPATSADSASSSLGAPSIPSSAFSGVTPDTPAATTDANNGGSDSSPTTTTGGDSGSAGGSAGTSSPTSFPGTANKAANSIAGIVVAAAVAALVL